MSDEEIRKHCNSYGYSDGEVYAYKDGYQQGRADAIDEFAKPVINGTLHTICRMIASGDIPTGVYQKWLSHTKIGFMTPLEIFAEIFKEQLKSQE